jgi:hypothetical protein
VISDFSDIQEERISFSYNTPQSVETNYQHIFVIVGNLLLGVGIGMIIVVITMKILLLKIGL